VKRLFAYAVERKIDKTITVKPKRRIDLSKPAMVIISR
jgi:hypothetical protein